MHNHRKDRRLQHLNVQITPEAKQRIQKLVDQTRFSQGEVIDHAINHTPLPSVVAQDNQQYVALNEALSHINQSLGNLSDDSDRTVQLILQGIREGQVPENEEYREIIQKLQAIPPALQQVNQYFQRIQKANLSFLYNHRYHSSK